MGIRIAPRYIDRVQLAFKRSAFRSQQALAEELGVVRSTVANFLKGKSVSRLNFIEISTILRLDWQEIADLPLQLDDEINHLEELNYRLGSMGASATSDNKLDRNCLRSLPYQNLPPQTNEFIGRSEEVSALM